MPRGVQMNTSLAEYCFSCGEERIAHDVRRMEFDVRGETLPVEVPVKVCAACGIFEYEPGVDPAALAFARYRSLRGLLSPDEIRAIRERYRLSQKSFAALLGMSEATINRYEGGGLQDAAHDQAIRACENPEVVRDLLRRRGHKLSDWQRRRAETALGSGTDTAPEIPLSGRLYRMPIESSLLTGYRHFDFERYAAVVVWFCRRLPLVTPTSLNKLLFYVDFLNFRDQTVSLTGAAYRRLPYGPVSADFGGLREQMELDQLVEIREAQWGNGKIGEEYHVGPRADQLETQFSPREVKVLETVAQTFETATPSQISERSHQEPAWRETEDRTLIPYDKARSLSLTRGA